MQPVQPLFRKEYCGIMPLLDMRRDPLNYFVRMMESRGDHVWFTISGKKVLLLNDATGIQHVFQDNYKGYVKGRFNNVLKPLLGQGIFLSEKELWFKQRKESAPVFGNGNFPAMTTGMVEAAQAMIDRWEPRVDRGEPIDLNLEMMWFTLDVVLRALFHEARDDVAKGVKTSLGHLLQEAERRIWALASLPQKMVLSLPRYKKSLGFLNTLTSELIAARKQNAQWPDDLLSRLIANYGDSPEDLNLLKDQVMSFLLAGHETTANGLAWAFYETGKRPDIKKQLFDETDRLAGDNLLTYDIAKSMHYTRQVFDEALRLYPPVWTMSRESLEEDKIPLDNGNRLAVPKGSTIMLCPYAVHRRDAYWRDPEAFDPERFTNAAMAARPKMAYFPFGGGARLCLGFRFAQIESIVAMAMVAQRYDWTLLPGQAIAPEPVITLRPDKPIYFRLQRRNKAAIFPKTIQQDAEAPLCPYHMAAAE